MVGNGPRCTKRGTDKGGFTQALLDLGKEGEVTLLTLEDIYKNADEFKNSENKKTD